jgi:hypothetical protein
MITLENALWVDAVQAIPQLAWRNLHQFRDVPGGMRGVLADEARVRNLPHAVAGVRVCVCVRVCACVCACVCVCVSGRVDSQTC